LFDKERTMSKFSVNFNSSAEYAADRLTQVERRIQKNMERLSSGLQINTAQDDAAGFAVREKMRADLAVMNKGLQNLQSGVSLIQTAEGTLGSITNLLSRMKELATQAASANAGMDRDKLEEEFDQLAAEIDRLANGAKFNGRNLLDGSLAFTGLRIHFGAGNDSYSDYLLMQLAGATLSDLGLDSTSIDSPKVAIDAMGAIDGAIATLNGSLAKLGAYQSRLESMQKSLMVSLENLQAAESIISDTDMAEAMVQLTRDQIIREAAMASLAQANDLPLQAVSLLLGK
jgi:flagellin